MCSSNYWPRLNLIYSQTFSKGNSIFFPRLISLLLHFFCFETYWHFFRISSFVAQYQFLFDNPQVHCFRTISRHSVLYKWKLFWVKVYIFSLIFAVGCKSNCDAFDPQRNPFCRWYSGSFPTLCTVGLPTAKWRSSRDYSLVSFTWKIHVNIFCILLWQHSTGIFHGCSLFLNGNGKVAGNLFLAGWLVKWQEISKMYYVTFRSVKLNNKPTWRILYHSCVGSTFIAFRIFQMIFCADFWLFSII